MSEKSTCLSRSIDLSIEFSENVTRLTKHPLAVWFNLWSQEATAAAAQVALRQRTVCQGKNCIREEVQVQWQCLRNLNSWA